MAKSGKKSVASAKKPAVKKSAASGKTTVAKAELSSAALGLALTALRSEAVQQQLRRAPQALTDWATEKRSRPSSGQLRAAAQDLNPAARFGQRGLERRHEKLVSAVTMAFGDRSTTSRPEVWAVLDELDQSIAIAKGLPTMKRKKMHSRIDDELDELEVGLIDALLPKS